MGIIIKQSLKASIASYLGVLIGAFNSLYLFPKIIGSEGIGVINVISAAASLFLPILQLGFNTSLVKYFPIFKEKANLASFITYAFLIPLLALGLFVLCWPLTEGLFSWLFEEKAGVIFNNIHWVLPLTGILVFYGLFESLAKANFKIVFPTVVRNLIWRGSMTLGVTLVGMKYFQMDDLAAILVWSWLICIVVLAFYVFSVGDFKLGWSKGFLKTTDLKQFNSFSGYVILLSLGGVLIQRIDQLMVASYLGSSAAGVFSTAMYFATLIEIPKRSVIGIIQPVLVESFKNEDLEKVDELYKKSSLNLFLIGGVLFLLIWINIYDVFQLIPRKEEFASGIYVVLFYCLARIIDMGLGCNNEIIVFSKYYKVNLPMQFLLVGIVMGTNMIFIPEFHITGAALATCVSVFSYNILRFGYLYWKMKIQPFTSKTLLALVVLCVFFFAGEFIPLTFKPITNVVVRSIIIGIPLLLTIYFLKISDVINDAVNSILKKLKKTN